MTVYRGFNIAVVPGWAATKTGIAVIQSSYHYGEPGWDKEDQDMALVLLERLEPGATPLIQRLEKIYDSLWDRSHCGHPDLAIATVAGREIVAQINGLHVKRGEIYAEQIDITNGMAPFDVSRRVVLSRLDLLTGLRVALDFREIKIADMGLVPSLIAEAKKAEQRPPKIVLDSSWMPDDGEELPIAVALALRRARDLPPRIQRKTKRKKANHSPWAL